MVNPLLASYYNDILPLSRRTPFPPHNLILTLLSTILPFIVPRNYRNGAIAISFPYLITRCFLQPLYTFGSPSDDYYNSAPFLALLLWYIDFVLLTPREGKDAAYLITEDVDVKRDSIRRRVKCDDLDWWGRAKWASRLMLCAPQRGIGWNWQVKNIPANPYATYSRGKFVGVQVGWAVWYYVFSAAMLVVLGWSSEMRDNTEEKASWIVRFVMNATVGWSGAIWVWCRLCCAYAMAAALSAGIELFKAKEWPPLMGSLSDAWSVRQMWSVVYHQTFRRLLNQPALRIVRLLGLRKGSLASKYTQLYLTFGISCLFHQYQMFNVSRKDMGEFLFFMSQPVAITFEDLVQRIWRSIVSRERGHEKFEKAVGWIWTVAWFSFSLHWYIGGLLESGVISDWVFKADPLVVGASLTPHIVEVLET